jgi:hypothetical protein
VVHGGGFKGDKIFVTAVALAAGRNVIGRLAKRSCPVVAGRACACSCRGVSISNRRPRRDGMMAGVALRGGTYVGRWLGLRVLRNIGAAVASGAIARRYWSGSISMAHGRRRECHIIAVADIARRGCRNVGGRFPHRRDAVMAGGAGSGDAASVGIRGRLKGRGVVAGVALGAGLDVGYRFAQGIGVVIGATMTGGTIPWCGWPCSERVAHDARRKGDIAAMANAALSSAGNMVGWLAQRGRAIVAGGTVGVCGRMGIGNGCPANGRFVARVALSACADMGGRFGLRILGQECAVVALGTEAGQSCVVHVGRCPGNEAIGVAGIALTAIRNVGDRSGERICVDI